MLMYAASFMALSSAICEGFIRKLDVTVHKEKILYAQLYVKATKMEIKQRPDGGEPFFFLFIVNAAAFAFHLSYYSAVPKNKLPV